MLGHCIDLIKELQERNVGFTFDFFAEVSVSEWFRHTTSQLSPQCLSIMESRSVTSFSLFYHVFGEISSNQRPPSFAHPKKQ